MGQNLYCYILGHASLIPCEKLQWPYMGKATVAATQVQEQCYPFLSVSIAFLFGLQRMFGCQCWGFLMCTQMLMQMRAALPIPIRVCSIFVWTPIPKNVCPCLGFLMCITLTDVDVYEYTWGLYGKLTARRKTTLALLHWGLEPASILHLAFCILVWCLTN